jgi:hypothetical protein
MCVIVFVNVDVVQSKVCKYTKDERWVKSGVKMDLLLTSIRLSRFLFRLAYMALFSCVSSCSVVSWRALGV